MPRPSGFLGSILLDVALFVTAEKNPPIAYRGLLLLWTARSSQQPPLNEHGDVCPVMRTACQYLLASRFDYDAK